jgi:hypothetical protein
MANLAVRHLDTGYTRIALSPMQWAQFPTSKWPVILQTRHIPREYISLEPGWAETVARELEAALPEGGPGDDE